MGEVRYAKDKPSDCAYCYFFSAGRKKCTRKECFYLLSSPPPHKKATAKRSSQNIVLPKTGTIMLLFLSFVKYSSAFVQKHTDIS